MGDDQWLELFATLKKKGVVQPVRDAAIDKYELTHEFKLPASYRSYCRVFGPGILGERFSIAIPRYSERKHKAIYDLTEKTRAFQGELEWKRYLSDPAQFERAVIFSSNTKMTIYFWDRTVVTDPGANEYGIYAMSQDWKVVKLCDSFWDFVQNCLHKKKVKPYDTPAKQIFVAAKKTAQK